MEPGILKRPHRRISGRYYVTGPEWNGSENHRKSIRLDPARVTEEIIVDV